MSNSCDSMSVAVVLVNFRTAQLASRCLQSLLAERACLPDMQVIVVDGGSGDGSAETLRELLNTKDFQGWSQLIPLSINGGFGYANNAALTALLARQNPPDFILLLNPDTKVDQGAVAVLANCLQMNPKVGAVGSQLLEPDGTPTGCAFPFPSLRGELARGSRTGLIDRLLQVPAPAFPPADRGFEVDWVTGASVMLRAEALRHSGLFDDGFFLYHEEIELMWRMRQAGWSIRHEPRSRIWHVGGAATGVHSRPLEGPCLPRRPAYWYESRCRYFALTRGRAAAVAAACLWVVGHAFWLVRRLGGLSSAQPVARELADQLRHGFPWRREIRSPSIRWDSESGDAPAWMRQHA